MSVEVMQSINRQHTDEQRVKLAVFPIMVETVVTTPVDVLGMMQQQSPVIQKVQRTIVILQLQYIDEIEHQLSNTDADTDEFQLLSDSGETTDDICSPTFVKIDEPADEGKEKVHTSTLVVGTFSGGWLLQSRRRWLRDRPRSCGGMGYF